MTPDIDGINLKIRQLTEELAKYKRALEVLQDVCQHEWVYTGHGHNNDYYRCSKCDKEKEE